MEADVDSSSPAAPWLPLSPGRAAGLAAFHRGRLMLAALLSTFLVAGAVVRLAHVGWFPAIGEAISQVPPGTALDGGTLRWPVRDRQVLADNMYLSVAAGAVPDAPGIQAADLHLEFTSRALWVTWMAGHMRVAYPAGYVIDLDPAISEPLWEAWQPHLYAGVFLGTALILWLGWGATAMVLAPLLAGAGRVLGRQSGFITAWWLAVSAFLPGSVLLAGAVYLYGFRYLNLPMALVALVVQVLLAALLLCLAPWGLPRQVPDTPFAQPESSKPPRNNPFVGRDEAGEEEKEEDQDGDGGESQDDDQAEDRPR
jgi:hypothetical protein